ncbi:MAG: hypothetical protein MUF23_05605 [Pirellula sp.]|jgi:hypothetical protein|nr:hypothetical protein [Pirellula sp.]
MSEFLFYYVRPEPPTWVFLSFFAVIGIFVVFRRFWSLRNLDILLVLAFTPGFMMVYEGRNAALARPEPNAAASSSSPVGDLPLNAIDASIHELTFSGWPANRLLYFGFFWLLICAGLLTLRMLLDTAIIRRPLLEPNLNGGGMLFIGISLLIFLLINVAMSTRNDNRKQGPDLGPGYVLLSKLPQFSTVPKRPVPTVAPESIAATNRTSKLDVIARVLAITANVLLVLCIVGIGYWHFGSFSTGVGAATFYLLLPYAAHTTGRVDHVVPGALLLLALLLYRQPFVAGLFLGCAAGVMYYPFSLLPLWCSFYWQRGIRRFASGFAISVAVLVLAMAVIYPNDLAHHLSYMFGIKRVAMNGMDGMWGLGWHPIARIPIIVVFVLLSFSFIFWPAQKNLATLMSCSAAIMAATQFWHGFGGGLYMAWFLPLAILTIFRPNLDYCVALEVVRPWKRKGKPAPNAETEPPLAAAG